MLAAGPRYEREAGPESIQYTAWRWGLLVQILSLDDQVMAQ